MLSRFVLVVLIGMVAFLCAVLFLVGHWTIALLVLAAGAAAVLLWAGLTGSWHGKLSDPDVTDEDLEREKSMQYYTRSTRIPPP